MGHLIPLLWYRKRNKEPILCSLFCAFLGFLHEKLERRTNLITGKLHVFNKKKTILTELIDIMDALHGDCFQVTNKDMIESEHSLTYLFVAYWQGFNTIIVMRKSYGPYYWVSVRMIWPIRYGSYDIDHIVWRKTTIQVITTGRNARLSHGWIW